MNATLSLISTPVIIASACSLATADSFDIGDTDVSLTLLDIGPSRVVSAYYDDGTDIFQRNVWGGQLDWSGGVSTFCVQLLETISVGQTRLFDVVEIESVPEAPPQPGPMGIARATLIRDLYARHFDDVMSATGGLAKDKSAAFAMLVWEVTHQESDAVTAAGILGDLDLSEGNARFSSNQAANTFADAWLAGLGGGTDDFLGFGGLVGRTDPTSQGYLSVVPSPGGLFAFIGLAAARRHRRRP